MFCYFNDYFNPLNGYEFFIISDNRTICACPDNLQVVINEDSRQLSCFILC